MTVIIKTIVVITAIYGFYRVRSWAADRRRDDERVINELIDANRAKPKDGMALIDWQKTNRLGGRAWNETLAAQRRNREQKSATETRVH